MFDIEEHADIVLEQMREFLDLENQFIVQSHDLRERLASMELVLGHIDENIPESMTHVHELNAEIVEKLLAICSLLDSETYKDLKIEREEEHILKHLSDDVKHKEWKAVKKDIRAEEKKEKKALRLQHHELRELHSRFGEITSLMEETSDAFEKDRAEAKQKHDYEKKEEYYLLQIYKLVLSYEKIFMHLWQKEIRLVGHV
jgi:hypothetical protein